MTCRVTSRRLVPDTTAKALCLHLPEVQERIISKHILNGAIRAPGEERLVYSGTVINIHYHGFVCSLSR